MEISNAHGPCIEICIKMRKNTYQYHRWHWAVRLAEHGDSAVTLLLLWSSPVFVWILGHVSDLRRQGFLSTLRLLQTQHVWILLTHPLQTDKAEKSDTDSHKYYRHRLLEKDHAVHNQWILTSRPFFLTHARRPSTFQEVIFMLDARPSLLVILSGGSSYRIGASGSFPFFLSLQVLWKKLNDALWRCKLCFLYALLKLYQLRCQSPRRQLPRSSWLF